MRSGDYDAGKIGDGVVGGVSGDGGDEDVYESVVAVGGGERHGRLQPTIDPDRGWGEGCCASLVLAGRDSRHGLNIDALLHQDKHLVFSLRHGFDNESLLGKALDLRKKHLDLLHVGLLVLCHGILLGLSFNLRYKIQYTKTIR